jgi:hypothetical protein
MKSKFVVDPSNFEATAKILVVNETPGFAGLSLDDAKNKLTSTINRAFSSAIKEHGEEKTFNPEAAWFCWKGLLCCFLPFSSGRGYEEIFEAETTEYSLVKVALFYSLLKNDLERLSAQPNNQ